MRTRLPRIWVRMDMRIPPRYWRGVTFFIFRWFLTLGWGRPPYFEIGRDYGSFKHWWQREHCGWSELRLQHPDWYWGPLREGDPPFAHKIGSHD